MVEENNVRVEEKMIFERGHGIDYKICCTDNGIAGNKGGVRTLRSMIESNLKLPHVQNKPSRVPYPYPLDPILGHCPVFCVWVVPVCACVYSLLAAYFVTGYSICNL